MCVWGGGGGGTAGGSRVKVVPISIQNWKLGKYIFSLLCITYLYLCFIIHIPVNSVMYNDVMKR